MGVAHIEIQSCEHKDFHKQVEPWEIEQKSYVEGDGTGVECEDVCPFHQGEAEPSELIAKGLGYVLRVAIFLLQFLLEELELGRLLFLIACVVDIGEQEEFVDEVSLPWSFLVDLLLLNGVVEFAACFSFQEEEVYLPIVVGESALMGVADDSGEPR